MRRRNILCIAITAVAGCQPDDGTTSDPNGTPTDVAEALAAMPEAQVLEWTDDSMPQYIVGEMVQAGAMQSDDVGASDAALRTMIPPVLKAYRLTPDDLALRVMNVDSEGNRSFRYQQVHNGLPVIGGDLVIGVDVKGSVYSANGTARGGIPADLGSTGITVNAAAAVIAGDGRFAGLTQAGSKMVYFEDINHNFYMAYEIVMQGKRGTDPARDKVYVDVETGGIIAIHPQIYFAENRKVYTAAGGTSTPGTLVRSEGQGPVSDIDINAAYDGTGASYEGYKQFWNRDSYNNAGGALISTVHYSHNYCNAYWDGTQMTYGDGDSSQGCGPLARSVDVTAHELTHGVTEYESNLTYSGESGGMNEAYSDIFGAFVEAWVDGGKSGTNLVVSDDTFLVGEDVISGGLRFMCDPAKDGSSLDIWTSAAGNVDVHYSSGIANLAFCLMTKGGKHPRNKTTNNVPAIGMEKALRILYKAQVDILTSSSKYANFRTATEQAAQQLGYDTATQNAVSCAWAAVGVGTAPASCVGGSDPTNPLTNGVPVTGISDSQGGQKFWKLDVPSGQTKLTFTISGGTGDANLYVQEGAKPTKTSYACRPFLTGNSETCTFSPPSAGTYYVMLDANAAYSGVTLTGTYSNTGSGDPYLTNGQAKTNISGASRSKKYFRIATPAGKTLTVKISGGTGDADLYTRFASRPTTSTYSCRPYLNGNNETCTTSNTQSGDYYIMLRGYKSYSGVRLIASY